MKNMRRGRLISHSIEAAQDFPDFRAVNGGGIPACFDPFVPYLRNQRELRFR